MREVKSSEDWSAAALKLVELKAPRYSIFDIRFDGHELPDVDLDALCDAVFADIRLAPSLYLSGPALTRSKDSS
jgi:hypothetical protein